MCSRGSNVCRRKSLLKTPNAKPSESLSPVLHSLHRLFPSTARIQASLKLNQMGAPLSDAAGLQALLCLLERLNGGWLAAADTSAPALISYFSLLNRPETVGCARSQPEPQGHGLCAHRV